MSYKCEHCGFTHAPVAVLECDADRTVWKCDRCEHWNPVINKQKSIQDYNVGESNYADMKIQPWDIFEAHPQLNYWECDIIKRLLRDKKTDGRLLDLEKIVHITQKLIELEKKKLGTL